MSTSSRKQRATIAIDQQVKEQLADYARLSNLSMADLVARMWTLWAQMEQVHLDVYPIFPLRSEENQEQAQ